MIQKWLLVCLVVILFSGCSGIHEMEPEEVSLDTQAQSSETAKKESLLIYSYDKELIGDVSGFEEKFACKVEVEVADINGYASMLAGVLQNSERKPDLMILEAEEVLAADLKPYLVELNSHLEADLLNQIIPYSLQQIKALNGEYFALPLDINPVTILYRRSIAKEVFGTDDLTRIEACFNGYDALIQAAEQLKEKEIKLFPDPLAFRHFANVGKTPWFDENGFYIRDVKKWKFLDTLKTIRVEGYSANAIEWSQDWFLGMKNELSQRVFAYVLPNWALKNIVLSLDENKEALADFAMIDGMIDHAWGGSYIALHKESEKQELALQFMKYLVSDVGYLKNRVEETGLISANQVANQTIIAEELSTFLGQQDYVQIISSFAKEVKLSIQEDEVLQKKSIRLDEMFQELIRQFIRGDFHTVDEALASFEGRVRTEFPELFPIS